jgi:hypothetical protein
MSGWVYFLHNWSDGEDLYKIGISKHEDISKRIKQLSTGNPHDILLVAKYKSDNYNRIETMLHNHFYKERKKGEWFSLDYDKSTQFLIKCDDFDRIITLLKKENPFYK